MNLSRKKNIFSCVCNVLTVVLVIYSLIHFFRGLNQGNMIYSGFGCLRYFTIDSNILAAVACAFMLKENIHVFKGETNYGKNSIRLKFTGTSAVAMTFFVVMVFLGPTMGYPKMFEGVNLYLHAVCPLLCIFSYILVESEGYKAQKGEALFGGIPALIYGTVYLIMVVFVKAWPDFYTFNRGNMWYLAYPIIVGVGALIGLAVYKLGTANK